MSDASATGRQRTPRDLSAYSDTVLYDVFYEAATQLGAVLVTLEEAARDSGDDARARSWQKRRLEVADQRDDVDGRDRATQIAMIGAWDTERTELDRLLL